MSLKAFHFVFIGASILLSLGFAAWSVWQYTLDGAMLWVLFAVVGLGATVALIRYAIGVAHKLKDVSYL